MIDLNAFIKRQLRRNSVFIIHGASVTQLITALHATTPTSKTLCSLANMEAAIEELFDDGQIKLLGTTRYVINDEADLPSLSDLSPHAQAGLRRIARHHGVDMLVLLNQLLISHDSIIANTYDCPGEYYDGKVESNGKPVQKIPYGFDLAHAARPKGQEERAHHQAHRSKKVAA